MIKWKRRTSVVDKDVHRRRMWKCISSQTNWSSSSKKLVLGWPNTQLCIMSLKARTRTLPLYLSMMQSIQVFVVQVLTSNYVLKPFSVKKLGFLLRNKTCVHARKTPKRNCRIQKDFFVFFQIFYILYFKLFRMPQLTSNILLKILKLFIKRCNVLCMIQIPHTKLDNSKAFHDGNVAFTIKQFFTKCTQ